VYGGIERFAIRLNLSDPPSSVDKEARMTDMVADCLAFWGRQTSRIHAGTQLTEVKLAEIGANGKYTSEPIIRPVVQSGWHSGPLVLPPQIALAVSLDTDLRGPRGRGRFYLPTPVVTLSPVAEIEVAEVEALRGSTVTWLEALNNASGLDANAPEVVIASTFGTNAKVTGVRVGRVLDTMRSRRRDLPERYTAIAPVG
jgi:hypothetical protein